MSSRYNDSLNQSSATKINAPTSPLSILNVLHERCGYKVQIAAIWRGSTSVYRVALKACVHSPAVLMGTRGRGTCGRIGNPCSHPTLRHVAVNTRDIIFTFSWYSSGVSISRRQIAMITEGIDARNAVNMSRIVRDHRYGCTTEKGLLGRVRRTWRGRMERLDEHDGWISFMEAPGRGDAPLPDGVYGK